MPLFLGSGVDGMNALEFFTNLLVLAGEFLNELFNLFVGFSPVWIVLSILFGVSVVLIIVSILRGRKL